MTVAKNYAEKDVPQICEAYGILMNARWQELSLMKKINTMLLGVGHATARVTFKLSHVFLINTFYLLFHCNFKFIVINSLL